MQKNSGIQESVRVAGEIWWRGRFALDGDALRATGSVEPYDPWDAYRRARLENLPTPVEELVSALRVPSDNADGALLRWVERYGLLGLAVHGIDEVDVATAPAQVPPEAAFDVGVIAFDPFTELPDFEVYRRSSMNLTWESAGTLFAEAASEGRLSEVGDSRQRLRSEDHGYAKATIDGVGKRIPIEEAWGPFFRRRIGAWRNQNGLSDDTAAGRSFRYPRPMTDEWWAGYEEPLDRFLLAAGELASIYDNLRELSVDEAERDVGRVRAGLEALHALTSVARPRAAVVGGTLTRTWAAPSLLCTLGLMVFEDIGQGLRPRRCGFRRCGKVFATHKSNRIYCDQRCRWSEDKAVQREDQAASRPRKKKRSRKRRHTQ